jgi:hypothetical protein
MEMKRSKWIFTAAGIWGLLVVPPMFFLLEPFGRQNPPAVTHPEFYYGFAAVATVWQLAFLIVATDPARFRPFMAIAVLEKAGWVATLLVLNGQQRLPATLLPFGAVDLLLGVLFAVAFVTSTPPALQSGTPTVHYRPGQRAPLERPTIRGSQTLSSPVSTWPAR